MILVGSLLVVASSSDQTIGGRRPSPERKDRTPEEVKVKVFIFELLLARLHFLLKSPAEQAESNPRSHGELKSCLLIGSI